jgi:hypothetical protein
MDIYANSFLLWPIRLALASLLFLLLNLSYPLTSNSLHCTFWPISFHTTALPFPFSSCPIPPSIHIDCDSPISIFLPYVVSCTYRCISHPFIFTSQLEKRAYIRNKIRQKLRRIRFFWNEKWNSNKNYVHSGKWNRKIMMLLLYLIHTQSNSTIRQMEWALIH